MIVIVNGKETPLPEETTLLKYLAASGYDCALIAVEKNGTIIPYRKESFASEKLVDGDKLEIVRVVGGG